MNAPRFAITHQPIVLSFVFIAMVVGLFNLSTMPRREDPEITIRDALIVTSWPGAPAKRVEELITDPIEAAIAEVAEIDTIESKSMTGISIIQLAVDDGIQDTDQVWDDVRAKVRAAEGQLPQGSGKPFVNSDFGDVFEIVFALYQSPEAGPAEKANTYSPRQLEIYAEKIEDELELIPEVGKVEFWGVQPERIYVEVDSADLAKLNLTAQDLRRTFSERNIVTPGGELDTKRVRYSITPTGEFSSVADINDLVIAKRDGVIPVRLGDLPISVDRRYLEPARSLARFSSTKTQHQNAIIVAVSMKSGRNVANMSDAVSHAIERLKSDALPPDLNLTRVNDLPRQVSTRITDFQINLLQGVGIVLLVAFLVMGWRPALIMAAAVPLSMLSAIAFVRPLGIELEQFAIASLIIALGLVVDNAVVISDNVVRLLREGHSKFDASIKGAQDLAVPILAATVTTICAFAPMLTITGNVGEYISSLPVVVTATLLASYFLAMTMTPITSVWLLKEHNSPDAAAGKAEQQPKPSLAARAYERVVIWAIKRRGTVLALTAATFIASLGIIPVIGNQFFPSGSRDQFFVKIWLPEGAPISQTSRVAKKVEKQIADLGHVTHDGRTIDRLDNVVTFIGTGGPRIMLTMEPEYEYPYYALLLVNTTDAAHTDAYVEDLRKRVADIPEARITVEKFVLGPPVKDPVAFRLSGPDPDKLRDAAREMVSKLKQTPGARQVYSDWGSNAYQVDIEIDDDAVNLSGVTHADVAATTQAILSGTPLTRFREGDHLVPIVLRTTRERREGLDDLEGIYVSGSAGQVPLEAVARVSSSWQPATIARRQRIPTVTIGARPASGWLANDVAAKVQPDFEKITSKLGPQYRLEQGGEFEETMKALVQVVRAVGLTIVLILLVLIIQYNQFLKPLIILLTIPLALTGVLIGLLTTGWALGFMANLGFLALAGIVINNAIVLIDFIEKRVASGTLLEQAVVEAGIQRMRPIFLTTITTIGGLLPLSLFGGPLWAPMTNGMIFGLLFATLLTLIVVPALFVTFARRFGMHVA